MTDHAPATAGPPSEPRVLVLDGPEPRDYCDGREITLADALARYGHLAVYAHRPNRAETAYGGPHPYGDPDTARLHLSLVEDSPLVATLVVRDADTASVAGGTEVTLAQWFTPCQASSPADGQVAVHVLKLDRYLHAAYQPFRVLPNGALYNPKVRLHHGTTRLAGLLDPFGHVLEATHEDFVAAPHLALGRHLLFRNADGGTWTWSVPVESVRVEAVARPRGYDGPAVAAVPAPTATETVR